MTRPKTLQSLRIRGLNLDICLTHTHRERERGRRGGLFFWYETVFKESVSLKTCISLLLLSLLNDYSERHQKTVFLKVMLSSFCGCYSGFLLLARGWMRYLVLLMAALMVCFGSLFILVTSYIAIELPIHGVVRPGVWLTVCSFIHSFIYLFIHSFIYLFVHSFIHSLTHSINGLIHGQIQSKQPHSLFHNFHTYTDNHTLQYEAPSLHRNYPLPHQHNSKSSPLLLFSILSHVFARADNHEPFVALPNGESRMPRGDGPGTYSQTKRYPVDLILSSSLPVRFGEQ